MCIYYPRLRLHKFANIIYIFRKWFGACILFDICVTRFMQSHGVCHHLSPSCAHRHTAYLSIYSALPQHKIITDKTAQTLHHTWTILIWILLYKYFGCCLCVCYDWALWFQFTHKILRLFKFSAIFCFVVVVVVAVVVAGRSSKVKGSWHMDVKNCERDTDRRR